MNWCHIIEQETSGRKLLSFTFQCFLITPKMLMAVIQYLKLVKALLMPS